MRRKTSSRKVFIALNSVFLAVVALLCILPMLNILAVSFSSQAAATAGLVKLWPVDFTLSSYKYVLAKQEFMMSMLVSIKRLLLGVITNTILTILVAYPLSKGKDVFKSRSFYTWFFLITILFSGGLVPGYMALSAYGLLDSIWVLVLPTAVPVFNIVILMNFFRQLPKEIEEHGKDLRTVIAARDRDAHIVQRCGPLEFMV